MSAHETFRLDDEVAIVTGANRENGIGRAVAYELSKAAAFVAATARSSEGVEAIEQAFRELAIEGMAIELDLEKLDEFDSRLEAVEKEAGKIATILVNNAAQTKDAPALALKASRVTPIYETNVVAPMELTRLFMRGHKKAQSPFVRVINMGSIVGDTGHPLQVNYAGAKAALANATRTWSQEWFLFEEWARGQNHTFNTVVPGYIPGTELTNRIPEDMRPPLLELVPSRRGGTPQEVASLVRFLASKEASYINGQSIRVDGGIVG